MNIGININLIETHYIKYQKNRPEKQHYLAYYPLQADKVALIKCKKIYSWHKL